MSTPKPRRITLEQLMTYAGTGPRTTRRLVREGKLPGLMDGPRYICSPGEFDAWYEGRWSPKPTTMKPTPAPTDFFKSRKAS